MIRRMKKPVTIDIDVDSAIGTSTEFAANGVLREIIIVAPALTGNVNYTIELLDEDNLAVFTKAAIAHNATTAILLDGSNNPLEHPLHGNMKVRITAAGAQETSDKVFSVVIYYNQ